MAQSIRPWLIILTFFAVGLPVFAQHYPFTTVTNKDGLPQSSVFTIKQDKQGYVWLATEAGLVKYDGYTFKNYSYFNGLNANFIFDIEFDRLGRLWLGSFGTGLAVYDGHSFYSFNRENGFPASFITDILFAKNGDLWVASKDMGIMRIESGYSPVIHSYPQFGKGSYGQMVIEAGNGDILGCGDKGSFRFIKEDNFTPQLIHPMMAFSIFEDATGGIWMGGYNELLYVKSDSVSWLSHWLPVETNVLNIKQPLKNGPIYICTENGLLKIENNKRFWYTTRNGLSYDLIKDVFNDSYGNTWIATYGNGATLLNDRGMTHYDNDGEGGDLCTFSIGEDKNGTMWIGKYFGGYFEISDTSIRRTTEDIPADANPLCSFTDAYQNVYLNSNNSIIYKITNGKVVNKITIPHLNRFVYGILSKGEDELLIMGPKGCIVINERDYSYEWHPGTKGLFMKDPFRDEYGNIWGVGELGQVYKLTETGIEDYTNMINPTRASITHELYDSLRHAWWFTTARGVIVWNGKQSIQLHSGNILKADLCFSLVMDNEGRVWVGHVQGVTCIDVENRSVTHLGYDQGFLPVETNASAAYKDSKGNVWFGTLTSVTKIDVNRIGRDSTKGITRIHAVEINNEVMYEENYNDTALPHLILNHFQNNVDIHFVSLCYTNSKDVMYTYQLKGVDQVAITKKNTREVNYINLKPGDYYFEVYATNPNGFITNKAILYFTIKKPFWNTIGFYVFEIVVFLFIVFLSFRFTRQSSTNRLGQIMTLVTIFILFESIMLYISTYTDKFTNGIPVFQLVMNVILASTLHPLEQRIQLLMKKWARKRK